MKNSSIYRSNLSNEKVAFLAEVKSKKELNKDDNTPKTYKRQKKDNEIDMLWQGFKINAKDEKSPGVYLLTGFIAGALCMFVMNSILSIGANSFSKVSNQEVIEQPKYEKKISRKEKIPQIAQSIAVIPADNIEVVENTIPKNETYIVKSGDSMSSIVYRFYGKYDIEKIEKIKQVNNLDSENKLSIGQELKIPLE